MGSRNRCRDGVDGQGGSARKRADDASGNDDYNNDYLAERCGRPPRPCRIIDRPRYLDDRPDRQFNTTPVMQAGQTLNRAVDGGVDSQA